VDDYSDAGTQFTPRGGLICLPTEKSAVKALYGRAFMAPSGAVLYGVTGYAAGDENIKPETIDSYELILMYKEKKARASLNSFYTNWKNGIVIEPNPVTGVNKYTNSGKNQAYGGEFNLNYQFDPVVIDLGLSYVRSTALKSDNIDEDKDYGTFPEYSVICGLNYFIKQIAVNMYLNNRVYLNMKETANPNEKDNLPPYWRMDLNISKIINEKLEMFLDVRNILNRKNEMPSLSYPTLGIINSNYANTGVNGGIPDPGISVLLRAGYKL
jgi:iron complex outermembrane receptor protein